MSTSTTNDSKTILKYNIPTSSTSGPISYNNILPFIPFEPIKNDPFDNLKIRRILILLNPTAGFGKAVTITSTLIIPILHKNNISTIIFLSKYKNHMSSYLSNVKKILSYNIDCFMIIGGDGTIQEFINGYIKYNYINYNIGIILVNGGTGNSICMTLNTFNDIDYGNNYKLFNKYLQNIIDINKNKNDDDNSKVIYCDSMQLFGLKGDFLCNVASMCYFGIPSASAIDAEYTKYLFGTSQLRYDVAAVINVIKHRNYRLRLTFYGLIDTHNNNKPLIKQSLTITENIELLSIMKCKYFGKGLMIAPYSKLNNGFIDVTILKRCSRLKLMRMFLLLQNMKRDTSVASDKLVQMYRCKSVKIEPIDDYGNIIYDTKKLGWPDFGIDGEFGPYLPLVVKIKERSIPLCKFDYQVLFKKYKND